MSNEPIDPNAIPQFTGDLEQLERDVSDLRSEASRFRDAGGDVHSDFQGLSAFYEAPEAEQLFATTKPVQTKTDAFADDLEKVAQALSEYATDVRPLAKKLKQLQTEASAFYIDEVSTDDDWRKDDDKRDHNNRLVQEVATVTQAFRAAEIDCHNKITRLVGGVQLRPSSDGTSSCDTYGYTDEVLEQAEEFPWGGTVEKDRDGVDWLLHKAKDVGKGFFIDGVGGAAGALATLVGQGEGGWGAAGEAWTNLGKLATGLTLSIGPAAGVFWLAKDDQLPSFLRDSRRTVVDTGKGLIAYDEWSKNPARAAGLVGFNALTILATRGAGAAAKGGAAAKTISAVSKFGRAVDPFTYAAKGVTFTVSKVGDLLAPLRNARTVPRLDAPIGSYHLVDDGARPSPRPASVPDNARAYADSEGHTLYMTRDGAIVDEHGRVLERVAERAHVGSAMNHGEPGGSPGSVEGHAGLVPGELRGGVDAHGMGTRRDFEARIAPESTMPVVPKQPGDIVLDTGDHVYFRDGATAIGYDRNTLVNFGLVKPVAGYHDVVVHGNGRGFFEPGRVNEAGVGFSLGDVHPSHIAEAIRNNPSYSGGAVRLVSCHTAWLHGNEVVDLPRGAAGPLRAAEEGARVGDPALHHPAAQEIANELGVPVMAPTHKVGVSPLRGPGQVPRIADNGYWRIFLPMAK